MINKLSISIWGRDFLLPVIYECYEGESASKTQKSALDAFVSHKEWIQKAKTHVEIFCKKHVIEDSENKKKDNVFSYVKPEAILVKRGTEHPCVALMCNYRYDLEHGLAVVFSYDGEITVGIQDIIL